ncbi:hypothetical protein ACWONS_004776 [Vibrio parahaemolyticus]|nr:hypothetical protein [Vibrio parahaemolyticus]
MSHQALSLRSIRQFAVIDIGTPSFDHQALQPTMTVSAGFDARPQHVPVTFKSIRHCDKTCLPPPTLGVF